MKPKKFGQALAALLATGITSTASAQLFGPLPVVDAGAILQLVTQLRTLENQLLTARDQLLEARNTYTALTGPRGMERLVGDVIRNYLPPDWQELEAAILGVGGAFGQLAADIDAILRTNAVLEDAQIELLTANQRQLLEDGRRNAASLTAISRTALAQTSVRFDALQELIDAIAQAEDPKAIADLQARIGAEAVLLQNEQTKLDALYQVQAARAQLRRQRLAELGIAEIGSLRELPPLGLP